MNSQTKNEKCNQTKTKTKMKMGLIYSFFFFSTICWIWLLNSYGLYFCTMFEFESCSWLVFVLKFWIFFFSVSLKFVWRFWLCGGSLNLLWVWRFSIFQLWVSFKVRKWMLIFNLLWVSLIFCGFSILICCGLV